MLADRLPAFPWDLLAPASRVAREHPDGLIDLSVGSPVDPVPAVVRAALAAAADAPGYPATYGTQELRRAAADWLGRRHGVQVSPLQVLPVIGTKEAIAWLPTLLGCGQGDTVVHPALAYPTYDIGARLAGATAVAADEVTDSDRVRLTWLNSPSNPTGAVLSAAELAAEVARARARGSVLASDECYIELGWDTTPVSVLHPDVCGGSFEGLLAVHSLSKRSNLAGYRAGFLAGDPALIRPLLEVRKHAGMIVPGPVQAAMTAALDDDEHADQQRARYSARRDRLRAALEAAGWRISHSEAGLYLWASHPERDGQQSVAALAELGILVAPGAFYGPAGEPFIRMALTATDEQIEAAAGRLGKLA